METLTLLLAYFGSGFVGLLLLGSFLVRRGRQTEADEAFYAAFAPIMLICWPAPFLLIVRDSLRAPRKKPASIPEAISSKPRMKHRNGIAVSDLSPAGKVEIEGAVYDAISDGSVIRKGVAIVVTGEDTLALKVTARA